MEEDSQAVQVPAELRPLFQRAEAYVRAYFAEGTRDSSRGVVQFHGERYIHVRASSISTEFFDLVRRVYRGHRDPDDVAHSLLYDVARSIGIADARDFRTQMGVDEPLEALSAGPLHFAYTGWAVVELHPESRPTPDDDYVLVYDHSNSFEAEAWLAGGREATCPVCAMNAGYSAGWCESSFGIPLASREIGCRAVGDPVCRFVMAQPHRLEEEIAKYAERHPEWTLRSRSAVPRFFDLLKQHEAEILRAQRMEAVARLAGGIAHDFNNLLTVILGCAEQLQSTLEPGTSQHRNATAILGASQRAGALTRQLLGLSRDRAVAAEAFDLSDRVRELIPLIESMLGPRQLVLGRLDPAPVHADPLGVEQVVVNLVVNAVEAMEEGGTLTLSVRADDRRALLKVRDDGAGIPAALHERVFEPFFTTKAGNTGLGLAGARGLLAPFDGTLELQSAPGEGTEVSMHLPLRAGGARRPSPETDPLGPADGAVVLVIEDDDAIRSMLGRLLPRRGYRVHLANSMAAASAVAAGLSRLDLVLCDVVMPGGYGPEAVAAVRQLHPDIAVVFMTGFADRDTHPLPEGAIPLRKPFSIEAVHGRLADALERKAPARETPS